MNKVFYLPRFSKLLAQELSISLHKVTVFAGLLIGAGILLAYFSNMIVIESLLVMFWSWLAIFLPFRLYPFLFDKIKGVQWSMQAASKGEKYASLFVQIVVIYPIVLLGTVYLSQCIATFIQSSFQWSETHITFEILNDPQGIWRLFLSLWSMQSLAIFGVVHFKPNKVQKSILWALLGIVVLSLLASGGAYIAKNNDFIASFAESTLLFIEDYMHYFLAIWALIFWTISYFRMSKHQF